MLKQLIKIRLRGMFGTLIGEKGRKKNLSKGKKIAIVCVVIYLIGILGVLSAGIFGSMLQPLKQIGYEWLYFSFLFFGVFVICFIGSIFLTKQEIYDAKDNELLLSLPIRPRDILISRLFSLCILNYLYEGIITIPALVIYFYISSFHIGQCILFLIVFLTFPMFVLILTCLFSWIFEMLLQKLRLKNIFIYVLYIGGFGLYFYGINQLGILIEYLVQNGSSFAEVFRKVMFPIYHLSIAIAECKIESLLLYLVSCILPFWFLYYVLISNFSRLMMGKQVVSKKQWKEKEIRFSSPSFSIMKRKCIQLFSHPLLVLNSISGSIIGVVGIIYLALEKEQVNVLINQIPQGESYIWVGLLGAMIAMNTMTYVSAISISLEGDRLWILKTLPISVKDIFQGIILQHILLAGIPMMIVFIGYHILFPMTLIQSMIAFILGTSLLLFMAYSGLYFDLSFPKLEWINEVSVVKHNVPLFVFSLGFLFLPFVMVAGYFILYYFSISCNIELYTSVWSILFVILAYFSYLLVKKRGEKLFYRL